MSIKLLGFFILPTVILAALVQLAVPCPRCGGTGNIRSSFQPESMEIIDLEVVTKDVTDYRECFLMYKYEYTVNISIFNRGFSELLGEIGIFAKDKNGKIADTTAIAVDVPSKATKSFLLGQRVYSVESLTPPFSISFVMPSGTITCPTCHGKGQVSPIDFLLYEGGLLKTKT